MAELKLIETAVSCQLRARERRTNLVPIKPTERHEESLGHLQGDIIGPLGSGQYKYALHG